VGGGGGGVGISDRGMRRWRGLFIKGGEVKRDGREGLEDGWGEAGTKRKGMDRGRKKGSIENGGEKMGKWNENRGKKERVYMEVEKKEIEEEI
jgi:hypothetical protein